MFEKCLTNQNFTREFVHEKTPSIVRAHAEQLIGCGIYDERETVKEVMRIQPQVERFANMYTSLRMSNNNPITPLEGHGASSSVNFIATNVQDTEEGTISTELGLKGFVDVTVKAKIKGCAVQQTIYGNEKPSPCHNALVGIELKTGHNQNPHMNHVAQLSLYTLTLRSRHGTVSRIGSKPCDLTARASLGASNGGMLLYLNHESYKAVHVSPAINEIKSLLSQRNIIATELKRAAKPRGISIQYEYDENAEPKTVTKEPKKR